MTNKEIYDKLDELQRKLQRITWHTKYVQEASAVVNQVMIEIDDLKSQLER